MEIKRTKIKLLDTLDHPQIISLYKISEIETLKWKNNGIGFDYHPEILKENIISVSKYVPGGLSFEPWVKIDFMKNSEKKDIYITSRRFLGIGILLGDNEKIQKELINRYINNK